MNSLLGIDIGTTNTKVIIFNEGGQVIEESSFPTPFYPDEYGGRYQPEEILHKLLAALRDFTPKAKKDVVALSISSFAEVMVGLDASLHPITKSSAWFDSRTDSQFQEMKKRINDANVYRTTGLAPQSKYSFYKLLWHLQSEPEVFHAVRYWVSMSGYLLGALCGVLSFDYSLASRTMLFDQVNRCWSQEMLDLIGVPLSTMAELTPSGMVLGTILKGIAQYTGLPETVQVITGGHDHLCAAVAVGVFKQGRVLISTGTTENLTMALDSIPKLNLSDLKRSFSWGHHAIPNVYYGMSGIYSGGFSLEWILKLSSETYQFLDSMTMDLPKEIALFFPYLLGADYDGARGAFVNLDGKMEKTDIVKALVASLCFEYKNLWDIMANSLSIQVDRVTNVGGGTRNEFWMQVKAAILGYRVYVPQDKEGSCKGAALLAGIGSGLYHDPEDAFQKTFQLSRVYEPDPVLRDDLLPWYGLYNELREDVRHINEKIKKFRIGRSE